MPRTNKELIQIVLDNFDKYFIYGLCHLIDKLYYVGYITGEENWILLDLIKKYKKYNTFFNRLIYKKERLVDLGLYYWDSGEPEPRRKYLEYLLTRVK